LTGTTPPELLVVVDTEEEFDWAVPLDRSSTATRSILAQERAQAIYERLGVTPTYVIDYPVATDPVAIEYLRSLQDCGRAEIGAHLHPWVTPPHRETVNYFNSYHCNLPRELEQAKIESLTDAIERGFGKRPTIFKAGRYGFGPRTADLLAALGYRVDCSVLARHDLRSDGGPDFRGIGGDPYWLEQGLLEVPVTCGFVGRAAWLGSTFPSLFDNRLAARLRLPGLLGKAGLVTRSRVTPEGVSAAEQCRLLEALVRGGGRTFTMAYHSPSLAPGNTPYVKNEAELDRFLETIEQVLVHFRDRLGGRFTSMTSLHARLSAERGESSSPAAARPSQSPQFVPAPVGAAGRGARC
jgi:hypothetical protein